MTYPKIMEKIQVKKLTKILEKMTDQQNILKLWKR